MLRDYTVFYGIAVRGCVAKKPIMSFCIDWKKFVESIKYVTIPINSVYDNVNVYAKNVSHVLYPNSR